MGELERFKTEINITEVAASLGYTIDAKESGDIVTMMRHPDGDKIAVRRGDKTGFWIYCSNRDPNDNGTILDFFKARGCFSFRDVCEECRRWLGGEKPRVKPSAFVKDLIPISRDRDLVLLAWERARAAPLPYLAKRGIKPEVLTLPAFAGCIRRDPRGNAIFPHFDKLGLCGFEIKNQGFTGFSAGGLKGLWYSKATPEARRLVFCESAIDALSYFILNQDENETRVMSTGGTMNPSQPDLIRAAMEKMPKGSEVVLAFDNDEGGERLAEEVRALAPSSVTIRRPLPPVGCKDWNDALKEARGVIDPPPSPSPPAGPDLDFFSGHKPRFSGRGGEEFRAKKGYAPRSHHKGR